MTVAPGPESTPAGGRENGDRARKAVIPAAGIGSRFLPATKSVPKEMLPLLNRPAIHHTVEEAGQAGIESLLIVTGRGKRSMEDYFDLSPELESFLSRRGGQECLEAMDEFLRRLPEILWVRQKEPLGLGHAVLMARSFCAGEPFSVLLPDELIPASPPLLTSMEEVRLRKGGSVLAVTPVRPEQVDRYGIIQPLEGSGEGPVVGVDDVVEKPPVGEAPSNLAVIGRYLLSPSVFEVLEGLGPGSGGEIQLTDALRVLCRREPVHALVYRGRRFDTGTLPGYMAAAIHLARRDPDLWQDIQRALEDGEERS